MSLQASPIRFGSDYTQAAPLPNDLWLAQYGGEVLSAFDELNVAKQLVRQLTISSGDSLEFPMLHKMAASRHAVGEYITGQDVATGKRIIRTDDRPILAAFEVDDVDKIRAHFDVQADLSKQAGAALQREHDMNALQLCVNASRTPADAGNSVFNGGGYKADPDAALDGTAYLPSVGSSDFATDTEFSLPTSATERWGRNHALTFLKALEEIGIAWDQRDIPQNERAAAVPPQAWHALRNIGLPSSKASTATTVGYNPFRGVGGVSPVDMDPNRMGMLEFNGFSIFRTNNLPRTNIAVGESKYRGNFTKTRAVAVQKQAVGMLMQMGVVAETGRDIRTQSNLFITKMLYGGGVLRPECAVEIAIS